MLGERINNYEIVKLLGEGGMGAVYLAVHPFLERKAAIKILKPECAANENYVQRFLNEARAANAIHHPNIIDIIDVGILEGGVPYMMMEFLQGESLADRLRRVERLSTSQAVFVAQQIASALAAAHAVGIIHRDLKPDNVFVVPDAQDPRFENIKVLDFGIAKLRPEFAPTTPRTSAGALMGTPAYMSPEQCMGKNSEIDHRSDVYALGVILFEMLCGQTPFQGENFGEYFLQHITTPPVSPQSLNPEIPPHLDALILRALAKAPTDRVQGMDEFGHLLAAGTVSTTLVLDEASGNAGLMAQRPPSLDDGAPSLRKRHRSDPSDPRLSHLRRSSEIPPRTTMSSVTGEMHLASDDQPAPRSGRKTAAIAIGALVLGGAVLGGLALWSRSGSPSASTPTAAVGRRTPEPSPPASPPPRPVEIPPPAVTPPPPVVEPEPAPAPEPAQPENRRPPRDRVRSRSSVHVETRPTAPERQATPTAAPPAVAVPSPANPAPPPRTITREKF